MCDYILFRKDIELNMYECKTIKEVEQSIKDKYHCIDNRECEVYGFYLIKKENIGE